MKISPLVKFFSNFRKGAHNFRKGEHIERLEHNITENSRLLETLSPKELNETVIENKGNQVSRGSLLKMLQVHNQTLLAMEMADPENLVAAAQQVAKNPKLLDTRSDKETDKFVSRFNKQIDTGKNPKKAAKAAQGLLTHAAAIENNRGSVLDILKRQPPQHKHTSPERV